jgi:hypothetical protein
MSLTKVEKASDAQAAMIVETLSDQRRAIAESLDALARKLRFRGRSERAIAEDLDAPDVLRVRRDGKRRFLFVGIARGFTEPVHDAQHHELVRAWVRRFARLADKRRGKSAPPIAGGYIVIATHDDASAFAWASLLTRLARPHRLQRDGAGARFVVRKLGGFWMAC